MREIKFRAWHKSKDDPYMQYGIEADGGKPLDFEDFLSNPKEWEIMQYIGIKGAGEERIFEGDIVSAIDSDLKWLVTYDRWGIPALARVDYLMGTDFKEMEMGAGVAPNKIKVIGNKWENPELLK